MLLAPFLLLACDPAEVEPPAETCSAGFYRDADGDGHGDATVWTIACDAPSGYVATADDCDDTNAAVHPTAIEICDGIDDDCDGGIDVGVADGVVRFLDADGDGFGDDARSSTGCGIPTGFVAVGGDCDDQAAAVHPDAPETCNEEDDDCDGLVDVADDGLIDGETWFGDSDGDHYGDPAAPVLACSHPAGTVEHDQDCDDSTDAAHPGLDEVCDGIDNDCDALADDLDPESAVDVMPFYADSDGDSLGNPDKTWLGCVAPKGWVADDTDCDDGDGTVGGPIDWFSDADGDGYGAGTARTGCTSPAGAYVTNPDDCDPADPDVFPGAAEVCDRADNNCDELVDEDDPLVELITFYADDDLDGYGDDTDTVDACPPPSGYIFRGGDCDDTDATVQPRA